MWRTNLQMMVENDEVPSDIQDLFAEADDLAKKAGGRVVSRQVYALIILLARQNKEIELLRDRVADLESNPAPHTPPDPFAKY